MLVRHLPNNVAAFRIAYQRAKATRPRECSWRREDRDHDRHIGNRSHTLRRAFNDTAGQRMSLRARWQAYDGENGGRLPHNGRCAGRIVDLVEGDRALKDGDEDWSGVRMPSS